MLEELLNDPEKFRIGKNYRASNIVFPVEFEGEKYILKRARAWGTAVQGYYAFLDKMGHGNRGFCSGRKALEEEARKLKELGGNYAPILFKAREGVLVKEYFGGGKSFFSLSSLKEKTDALVKIMESIHGIHKRGVIIGDAHIKNALLHWHVFWLDFDGFFDERDAEKAKAFDFLKLAYSVDASLRDDVLTLRTLNLLSDFVPEERMRAIIQGLGGSKLASLRLKMAYRIPIEGFLNNYFLGKFFDH